MYINTESNHPKTIIDHLPTMIETRLSNISSNEDKFNQEVGIYQKAIDDAGYKDTKLKYSKSEDKKSKRTRKVYYFNAPYTKNMSSDITKMFNHIMIKNFPKIVRHWLFYTL